VEGEEERNYSEDTARVIDTEVRALVEEARRRAHEILVTRRPSLEVLSGALEEKEVLDRMQIEQLLKAAAVKLAAGHSAAPVLAGTR
jgi:cell division protease FtsH